MDIPAVLHKPARARDPAPNLADYERACGAFSWDGVRAGLGIGEGGWNIAGLALDRHLPVREGQVALRCLGTGGPAHDITYAELAGRVARFAGVLEALGVGAGATVCTLLGRVAELYVTALGTLRHRAVYCPLFSAFGPEPIRARLARGHARVLVTTPALYARKVAALRDALPELDHVLLVGLPAGAALPSGTQRFETLLEQAAPRPLPATGAGDPALLHFTSGTTGTPKGALHVHGAVLAHYAGARFALDLHPGEVYWCTADPGWVTGTSYGIVGPLAVGATLIVDAAEFDAERWYATLARERVAVWYTAPTAIRRLMRAGAEPARAHDLAALRFAASVGEPLNAEAVVWGQQVLGVPFHDNWWQTETGGIMIANYAAMDIKPGSMGRPLPGIAAAVVQRAPDGTVAEVAAPDVTGELAMRPGWPSMFRAYLDEPERYAKCFAGGWYLSGDLVRRDADGYYWFVGRGDDVIKTSGHLVGPFEVEEALMSHGAVAEAAAIGVPDPVALEVIRAYVALKPGYDANEALRDELLAHARLRLGAAVAPREIVFADTLPKTRSGKIMRRLIKARALGLPEGDTSTLEPDA